VAAQVKPDKPTESGNPIIRAFAIHISVRENQVLMFAYADGR
jgi:hypothetical protein